LTTGVTERTAAVDVVASGGSAAMDYPRWIFTDYCCGVLGAFAALLGLYQRGRTGQGSFVETSLVRATALEQILYLIDYPERDIVEPRGRAQGWSPLQQLHRTADGWIFVAARAGQRDELLEAVRVPSLDSLADAFAVLDSATACATLQAAGISVHEVANVTDIMASGGVAARRGLRVEDRSERFGTIVMLGPVVRFSRTPMRPGALPTPFGADRAEVMAEWAADAVDQSTAER
jgi:crotonobetainyl-CoA:carnitine CoA-transferase CaiB-like acyl-CoA transferase